MLFIAMFSVYCHGISDTAVVEHPMACKLDKNRANKLNMQNAAKT